MIEVTYNNLGNFIPKRDLYFRYPGYCTISELMALIQNQLKYRKIVTSAIITKKNGSKKHYTVSFSKNGNPVIKLLKA